MRKGSVRRTTRETDVEITIDLDGVGASSIATGIGFLDHMLELLARHFVAELCSESGLQKRLSDAALETLRRHSWPGNVRELRNVLQRAFILADDVVEIDPAELNASQRSPLTGGARRRERAAGRVEPCPTAAGPCAR